MKPRRSPYLLICITGVIGLIWLFGIIVSLPPLLGWGTYEYSHSSYSCGISINEE